MKAVLDRPRPDAQAMTPRRLSLLLTGALPGPLFPVASFARGPSRDGFSFPDQPPSPFNNGDALALSSSDINDNRSQEGVVE
jgi:hypothetical protein